MNQGFEYARDAVTGFYQAIRKVRDTLQALRDAGYGDALDRIGQGHRPPRNTCCTCISPPVP